MTLIQKFEEIDKKVKARIEWKLQRRVNTENYLLTMKMQNPYFVKKPETSFSADIPIDMIGDNKKLFELIDQNVKRFMIDLKRSKEKAQAKSKKNKKKK